MALELEGKVALVSGGSKGIGLAVARTLALNGAKVAILSRHAGNLEPVSYTHLRAHET